MRLRYLSAGLVLAVLTSSVSYAEYPADKFDLGFWKLTLPLDENKDGKIDEIKVGSIHNYSHPDFFYLDQDGYLVFAAPNKAITTANSTNTRSELRQMFRGKNTRIGTHDPKNNFAIEAHRGSKSFADIGGQLEATLKVLHVARNAKHVNKKPAFSVVVGQIHADKDDGVIKKGQGFGWGNEPIKIYYKKWPDHDTGSVFWTYERNLARTNPDRTDIAYPVWGNTWENPEDPGDKGIALGQFSTTTLMSMATSCTSRSERRIRRRQSSIRSTCQTMSMLTERSTKKITRKATRAMLCTSKRAPTTSAARMITLQCGIRPAQAPETGQRTKLTVITSL